MLVDPGSGLEHSDRKRQCQLPPYLISTERASQSLLLTLINHMSVVGTLRKVYSMASCTAVTVMGACALET